MSLDSVKQKFTSLLKPKAAEVPAVSTRLACDLGKSKIIFLELEKSPDGVEILKYTKMLRTKEKLSETLTKCREEGAFSTHKLRLSLKGQGVIVRFIQFPKMKPDDLKAALAYEAEKYIPFKSSEVIIDFHVLDENATDENMDLLLVAVKRDDAYSFIQMFQDAGFQIELVDIDALAGINALEYFYPKDKETTVGILDIGTDVSTLSVVQKGVPRFIRDIPFGGVDIVKRLKRKLGISEEVAVKLIEASTEASEEASDVLRESIEDLVTEVKVSVDYYMDQSASAEALSKIYFGGGGGYLNILKEAFTANMQCEVFVLEIFDKIKLGESVDKELVKATQSVLPVALGLALRDL